MVFGGGDSAAVNMREAIAGQILLYPESRVPFDTPAAVEHNSRSHCLYGITVIALVLYSSPMIRRTAFFFSGPESVQLNVNLDSSIPCYLDCLQQSFTTAEMLLEVIGNGSSLGACLVSVYCSDWPKALGLPVAHHGQGCLPICLNLQFPKLDTRHQTLRVLLKAFAFKMRSHGWL